MPDGLNNVLAPLLLLQGVDIDQNRKFQLALLGGLFSSPLLGAVVVQQVALREEEQVDAGTGVRLMPDFQGGFTDGKVTEDRKLIIKLRDGENERTETFDLQGLNFQILKLSGEPDEEVRIFAHSPGPGEPISPGQTVMFVLFEPEPQQPGEPRLEEPQQPEEPQPTGRRDRQPQPTG